MRWLRRRVLAAATRALTRRRATYHHILPSHVGILRTTLRKGDVVLVDGDQRVSQVIKYLTQSSWSHAALYVGDELWHRHPERRVELGSRLGPDTRHVLIEATMEEGVVASPLAKYEQHNLRVCRPHGLRPEHCRAVLDEVLGQLGSSYAVADLLALARYFFPVSIIPLRWHRRALELGDHVTKQVICSTLIARAFHHVGFPILPAVSPVSSTRSAPWPAWLRRGPYPHVFQREPCALITPRDFDLSPYFDVVKLTAVAERDFDYRRIRWA
jgi:cell wall-associated NlpC family hydrolase